MKQEDALDEVHEFLRWYATGDNADLFQDKSGEALLAAISTGGAPSYASNYVSLLQTGKHPNAEFVYYRYDTNIKSGRFNVTLDIDAFDFSSVIVSLGSFTDGFKDDGMKVPKVIAIKKITNMSYNCTKLKSVVCNNFETQKLSSSQTYENGPSGYYPNSYHIVRRCLNTINILPALPEFGLVSSITTPYEKNF